MALLECDVCMHFSVLQLGDLLALMCVKIVDLSSSLLLSSNPACQPWTTCWVELHSLHGHAQRNNWPCCESWAESCQGCTSCFCLRQTVHCHHYMSGFILFETSYRSSVSLCTLYDLQNPFPQATEINVIRTDYCRVCLYMSAQW